MAYNHQQVPFWDFIRSLDQQGAGVDHTQPPNSFGNAFHSPNGPPHYGGSHPHHPPPPGPPPHHGGANPHQPPPPPGPFGFFGPFGGFGGPAAWGGPGGHGPEGHGPGPCHGGKRGRHCRRDRGEKEGEPSRSRNGSPDGERAEGEKSDGEAGPSGEEGRRGPRGFGGRGGHGHGWGGRGGRGHHGRRGHPSGGMGGSRGFGGPGGMGNFDLSGLFNALNSHPMGQQPWAQMLRQYAEQAGLAGGAARSGETLVPEDTDAENTFVPPVDVFSTETAYILHIALPGAKKEDVGVNWDADKGVLNVAGVVYRHGDEEFLKTLSQSERKVGIFERTIKLPPGEAEKEEVDGDAISAKLEDGVLVVTVPKVEKDENWTEVKRIDIL